MIKADLITGFLGSGKTTFIKRYVDFLINKGEKVCILENDFGAINVDMMLLQDLKEKNVGLEMIAGGCDLDCHIRRFKTKLITISMLGYDRVIIEPSGLFDVDELFDIVHEDEVSNRVKIDNIITLVDVTSLNLNDAARYLFTSQLSSAGRVILTHLDKTVDIDKVIDYINNSLKEFKCSRVFSKETNITIKPIEELTQSDFELINNSKYQESSYLKKYTMEDINYDSLFFMNPTLNLDELNKVVPTLFNDLKCGNILRIKGFLQERDKWYEINANHNSIKVNEVSNGQKIIIVIGTNLDSAYISSFIPSLDSSYTVEENAKALKNN